MDQLFLERSVDPEMDLSSLKFFLLLLLLILQCETIATQDHYVSHSTILIFFYD